LTEQCYIDPRAVELTAGHRPEKMRLRCRKNCG